MADCTLEDDLGSEVVSLSGSDFTLYSSEAASDEVDSEPEIPIQMVGDLIPVDDKKQAPARPPPPSIDNSKATKKSPRQKKSPVAKKRSARRQLLEKNLQISSEDDKVARQHTTQSDTAVTSGSSTSKPPTKKSTSKESKAAKKKPDNQTTDSKSRDVVPATKSSKDRDSKTAAKSAKPKATSKGETSSPSPKTIPQKSSLTRTPMTVKRDREDIASSASIEEIRAAGDGASEDNESSDLRSPASGKVTPANVTGKIRSQEAGYIMSTSIDSQNVNSDMVESSERESTLSESTDDSSSDEEVKKPEPPKSSHMLDFLAMADRISTTVKATSNNIKKIKDSTNVTKLVGGLIKDEVPRNDEGAWEKVDEVIDSDSDSSHEFDDDYDPAAEADSVGQAFGDYKQSKKKKRQQAEEGPVKTEFDDTYNPEVDASDPLAGAFGDGFRVAKPKEVSTGFDDDFSSGAKTGKSSTEEKKPKKASSTRTSKPKQKREKVTASKPPERPPDVQKSEPVSTKPKRPTASPGGGSKPARPSQPVPATSAAPPRPTQTVTAEPTKSKRIPGKPVSRPVKKEKLVDKSEPKQPEPKPQPVDLLGGLDDVPDEPEPEPDVQVSFGSNSGQPSNLDLLMGTADVDVGFQDSALDEFDAAVVPSIPQIPQITETVSAEREGFHSRSSSADLLDAFEFFNPASDTPNTGSVSAPDNKPSTHQTYLTSPEIKIIAASTENLASNEDDLSYLDSLANQPSSTYTVSATTTSHVPNMDLIDDLDPLSATRTHEESSEEEVELLATEDNELHIDTTSDSDEAESDNGGLLVRDESMDFDEILHRPVAVDSIASTKQASEVWAGTDDSGIGVEFKATFSVEDDLEDSSFGGNDTFESLIEKYTDVADGKPSTDGAAEEACRMGVKARAEVNDSKAVSAKRAMKFARTFSETIDEDDNDDFEPENIEEKEDPLSVSASTGLGLLVNPMETDREDADGEEGEDEAAAKQATPSNRHVWIDMSKPMPKAKVKPQTRKEKAEEKAAAQKSTIKLLSQEARQNMQVKVKTVPRPKGRELPETAENERVEAAPPSPRPSKSKKLVTQGQADNLNIHQLKEHTTLAFEIDNKPSKKKSKKQKSQPLPILPPPPKNVTPTLGRKNPFNRADSTSDEEHALISTTFAAVATASTSQLIETGTVPSGKVDDVAVTAGEVNEECEEDNECLIGGGASNEKPEYSWENTEKTYELPSLEEFRPRYEGHGWKMLIRKPPKKSLTKKRFWEEIYLRIEEDDKGIPCLLIYRNERDAKKGAKELERARLNPFHQLSDNIYLQQFDQFGKCHSVKVLHVSYKERPSLRTDRVTEALPNFLRGYMKPNKATIFEHAPTVTELYKFGSLDYRAMRMFVWELEDRLMGLNTERINTNTMYQKNEIVADAWDEYEACIDREGHIVSHKARVRLFMLCFVSGMPIVEVGINDRRRRGKEIVRRHEIIPVKAENWITVENVELHSIVKRKEYDESGVISFVPLDGSKFEFMRFRYRPKTNRELPLQIGTKMVVDRVKRIIELRADLLIPGYYSNSKRKGQVPCENIQICFPIPEIWVYKFRVEKHQKMGSLHAAARKPGKVKGIERLTTAFGKTAENYLPPSFIECSVGDAKYENIFKSVVWRVEKLPRFNEGAYKSHYFALRLELGKHDVIPDSFEPHIQVEYIMPHTTVSGTAIRSISCSDLDEPPEKWVHHHARYEYTVEIDFQSRIIQLLPDENLIGEGETPSKTPQGSPVKTTKKVELSDGDDSSIEIDEDREDSDDTDEDADSDSESERNDTPAAVRRGEDSDEEDSEVDAEAQGYATLVDLNADGDDEGLIESEPLAQGGTHLSELLDLTEVTSSPSRSPKPRRASVQQDDLDLL